MVLVLGLLGCAGARPPAALGWSLGGEAHVFVAGDRFARDLFHELSGGSGRRLADSLTRRPLVAVDARRQRSATVLSASGAAPARLTLARFHAPRRCGYAGIVTELVFAFPPEGTGGRSTPPSHVTVVALLEARPFAGGPGARRSTLTRTAARELVNRVAQRAESVGRRDPAVLVRQLTIDPDQAADAGEVVALGSEYAVGFRARYITTGSDTLLITGVAATDPDLRDLRWIVRPQRLRLSGGMIAKSNPGMRYSVRGTVTGAGGGALLLLNEIADVSPRDSRASAIDPETRKTVAAQPLALRCP